MKRVSISLLAFLLVQSVFTQTTIWSEPFTGYTNCTTIGANNNTANPAADWTTVFTDCDDPGVTCTPNQSYWGTYNGEFRINDIEGGPCNCGTGGTTENFITTESINISGFSNVSFSVAVRYSGSQEASALGVCDNSGDLVHVTYSLNGGPFVQAATNGLLTDDYMPNPSTASQNCINGNTLVIRIQAGNKANDENFYIDNILVQGFPGAFQANAGTDDTICPGGSTGLLATGGGTYQWNSSANLSCTNCANPIADPPATESFIVTVNQNGCFDSDTVTVFVQNMPINLDLGNDTLICNSPVNLLLNATSTGATYLWQNASTNPTFTATTPGMYFVQVTNACGSARDTITITQGTSPVVNLGADTSICSGDNGPLYNVILAGSTYLWQDGNTNPTYQVVNPGTYYVTLTNNCGTARDTAQVFLLPVPSVNLGNDILVCNGNVNQVLNASQPFAATYVWQDASTNPTFTATAPGTYFVQVSNVCASDADTIQIASGSLPTVNLGSDTAICPGAMGPLYNVTQTGVTYVWQDGNTNPTYQVVNPGTYYVTLTNNCGSVSDTAQVFALPLPNVNLGNDTLICTGTVNLLLNASQPLPATYVWQDASTNPTFTATAAGTYSVTATNICGSDSDNIVISLSGPINVNLGADRILCDNDTLVLDATTNFATGYVWQDNSTLPQLTVTQAGIYFVTATSACGSGTDTIQLFPQMPVTDVFTDINGGCGQDSVTLSLSGIYNGVNVLWSNGDSSLTTSFTQSGIYYVTINYCGNNYTDTFNVVLKTGPGDVLYMPNAFTPNFDEVNPTYGVKGIFDNTVSFSARIFDRWGMEVFTSNDPNFKWDGTYGNNPAPIGVYYLVIEMERECESPAKIKQGTAIQLIR